MYQISYKNRKQKFPDIGNEVHGYKKTNYFLIAVLIGLGLAFIWLSYCYGKKTDQQAKTYFQSITVEQPIKTSAQRIILQGE